MKRCSIIIPENFKQEVLKEGNLEKKKSKHLWVILSLVNKICLGSKKVLSYSLFWKFINNLRGFTYTKHQRNLIEFTTVLDTYKCKYWDWYCLNKVTLGNITSMLNISVKFKSLYICWSRYNISTSSHCLQEKKTEMYDLEPLRAIFLYVHWKNSF